MTNLSLGGSWSFDPLRRLSSNTAHHVSVGEGLRSARCGLDVERGRDGLSYARVQRRGSAGNNQVAVMLIARSWAAIAVAGPRADEGRVVIQRGRHGGCGIRRCWVSKLMKLVGREESRNMPDIDEKQWSEMKRADRKG